MNNREDGYYWVKEANTWYIAEYHATVWQVMGSNIKYPDEYWDDIDETPIKRNEQ